MSGTLVVKSPLSQIQAMPSSKSKHIYNRGRLSIRTSGITPLLIITILALCFRCLLLIVEVQDLKKQLSVYQTGTMKLVGDRIEEIRVLGENHGE